MSFSRNLDFFRVLPDNVPFETSFLTAFQQRVSNPQNTGVLQIADPAASIYLWKFNSAPTYCEGMIVRQRTQDVPKKGNYARNSIRDFSIQPAEGFAEMSYFVYLPRLRVLGLLAGKNAVKSGLFSRYAQEVVGISDFELQILLNPDSQQQLERWHNLTRLQWKVSLGIGFSAKSPFVQSRSVREMLDEEKHPTITITQEFSNPKRSGSLSELKIKEKIKRLLRGKDVDPHAELKIIKVRGSESPDEEEAVLDLLANKFRLGVTLETGNTLSYRECQQKVRRVALAQQSTLRRLLGDTA